MRFGFLSIMLQISPHDIGVTDQNVLLDKHEGCGMIVLPGHPIAQGFSPVKPLGHWTRKKDTACHFRFSGKSALVKVNSSGMDRV